MKSADEQCGVEVLEEARVEQNVGDGAVYDVRNRVRRSMPKWVLVLTLSLGAHGAMFHEPLKILVNENMIQPYKAWAVKRAKMELNEELPAEFRSDLDTDIKKIGERNSERKQRVLERAEVAKEFKAKLFEDYAKMPYSAVFFDIEYFDQGVSDDELAVARPYFRIVADGVSVDDRLVPKPKELQDLVKVFQPEGSHERTKTSAVDSLVHKLGPKSQNCVARNRLMIMAIATKYPGLQQNLYVQKFGDHERALFDVGGVRYILEGNADIFPDTKTSEKKNEVMPFEVWLALYSGHKRSEFEGRIEKFGPQSPDREKTEDYARVTDNMVNDNFWDNDLDNVGTVESWFGEPGGRNGGENGLGDVGTEAQGDAGMIENSNNETVGDAVVSSSLLEEEIDGESLVSKNVMTTNLYVYEYPNVSKEDIEKIKDDPNSDQIHTIRFPLVTTIDKEVAQSLVDLRDQNNGMRILRSIQFEKLNKIDEETAGILAKFGGNIELAGFMVVPVEVMRALNLTDAALTIKAPIVSAEAMKAFIGELPGAMMTDFFDINDLLPEDADSMFDVSMDNVGSGARRRYRNSFRLVDCVGLSNDAADALSRYEGPVMLENVTLTQENVAALSRLHSIFELTDVKAKSLEGLEKSKAQMLSVKYSSGELPVDVARVLSGFENSLTVSADSISVEAARFLGQRTTEHVQTVLRFNNISNDALAELFKMKSNLDLNLGSVTIDEKLARVMVEHEGAVNFISSVKILLEAAPYIAQIKAESLGFSMLVDADVDVLRQLAKYKGDLQIRLAGGKQLKLEQVRALSAHKGHIRLSIKNVTPEMFVQLMKIEGNVDVYDFTLLTDEMVQMIQRRFANPALANYRLNFASADIQSKRSAVILHNINGGISSAPRVSIEDIAMQKVNAPFRQEIKWGK